MRTLPFKFGGYADGIISLVVASVIRTFLIERFQTIGVFATTSITINFEILSRTGGETDLTAGSLITVGGATGDNMVLTVIGASWKDECLDVYSRMPGKSGRSTRATHFVAGATLTPRDEQFSR
jgi:hypothetical protein